MARKYRELRKLMFLEEVDQETLGKVVGRGKTYICTRLTGQHPFYTDEAYKILDYFGLPHEQFSFYFPPGGVENKTKTEGATR